MTEKPKAIEVVKFFRPEFPSGAWADTKVIDAYPAPETDAYLASKEKEKELLLRFFRHYRVLDGEQRRGVCATINEQPIAWRMAYREISHQTELGARILKELDEKKVI